MENTKTVEFAVKALLLWEGKFLAVHKRGIKSTKYELPGGRMAFGETAEQTVVREVHEETGLTVVPTLLLDTWNYVTETRQVTGIIYLCTVKDTKDFVLSHEHDDYAWLTPEAATFERMNRLFATQMHAWDWGVLKTVCGKIPQRHV